MASKSMPSRNAAPGKDATVGAGSPNQTLYITNLPEKINKNELKRALYMLFSTYGPVLDIVTRRMKMRGQAHVVYRDIQTSTQAMRALQGFDFFGKEMKIVYAKGQSQVMNRLRGTFEMPTAQVASEATELQKSIFDAPPSGIPTKPVDVTGARPADSVPSKPLAGTKRHRDEDEADEASDAANEDDDEDDDVSMEASSDED